MKTTPRLLKLVSVAVVLVVLASVTPIAFAQFGWYQGSPATGLATVTSNANTGYPTQEEVSPQDYLAPERSIQQAPDYGSQPVPGAGGYNQGPPSFDDKQFSQMFGLQLPSDQREQVSFSDFGVSEDDAINAAIRERVSRAIFEDIDEDVLAGYAPKCLENKESEIVEDIMSHIGSNADFSKACANAERMVTRATEASTFCDELPKLFEKMGPQEGEFKLTCPPSKESIIQLCETKVTEQVEREKARFEKDSKKRCEQQANMGQKTCVQQAQQQKQQEEWQNQQWEKQQQNWNNPPYPGDGENKNYQPPPDSGGGGGEPDGGGAGSGGGDSNGGGGGSPATGGVTYGDPGLGGDPYVATQENKPQTYPVQPGQYQSQPMPNGENGRYIAQSAPGGFGGGPGFGGGGFGGQGVDFMDYCEEGSFNESGFVTACVEGEAKNSQISRMQEKSAAMCEVQSRFMMSEFDNVCEQMEEGKNNCVDSAEKAVKFAEKQLSQCEKQTSKDKIRGHVTKRVKHICTIDRVKAKRKQSSQLAEAKELEAIDEIAKLSEYFTDETGDAVTGTVTEKLVNVAEVTQQTQERNDREKKDMVYGIGKFFGLNAGNEKEKATRFKEQAEELRKSAQLLDKAGNGIQNSSAQNDLRKQVSKLESRAEELDGSAKEIENTGGVFGGQV